MKSLDEQLMEACFDNNLSLVKYCISNGAHIDTNDNYAIRVSAEYGYLEQLHHLNIMGGNIFCEGDLPFHLAAENGHLDVVVYLFVRGSYIHSNTDYALRSSARNGHYDVVNYLLENGADVNAVDGQALYMSANKGHIDIVKLILEYNPNQVSKNNALQYAALIDRKEICQLLLANGADIECLNKNCYYPMYSMLKH